MAVSILTYEIQLDSYFGFAKILNIVPTGAVCYDSKFFSNGIWFV